MATDVLIAFYSRSGSVGHWRTPLPTAPVVWVAKSVCAALANWSASM